MPSDLSQIGSPAARRIAATLVERGWDLEVVHRDGRIVRGGRLIQDVPCCTLKARRDGAGRTLTARVHDWHRARAELEAAADLLRRVDRAAAKTTPGH